MKNYYYILGVHNHATIQEIKSAYRKLAIRLHPDKNAGDKFFEERFKDIKEAYEALSDNLRRTDYDMKLRDYSRGGNDAAVRKYKELLKRKYKDELKKREEDIKEKYMTLEQRLRDEAEKRKEQEEAKRKEEKLRVFNEIEVYKTLLAQKDKKLQLMKLKLAATEAEIIKARKDVSLLISKIKRDKGGDKDKGNPMSLQENAEILKELVKIKNLVTSKDLGMFLKMVLQYAETRSLSPRYGRDHPHLVKLILQDTIRMKPFKLFYAKYRNPETIEAFKSQLFRYFNLSQIS